VEKAIYEVHYELNNRPDWIAIPALGLRRLSLSCLSFQVAPIQTAGHSTAIGWYLRFSLSYGDVEELLGPRAVGGPCNDLALVDHLPLTRM
jgi:hypothetical protein